MNVERRAWSLPGIPTFLVLLVASIALGVAFIWYVVNVLAPAIGRWRRRSCPSSGSSPSCSRSSASLALFSGLTPVNPNEARALVLFGHYGGTVREQGLQWVNPFTERRKISVRVRNFETSQAQGQRPRRQPDRDRRGRRVAGHRHRRGPVRGRRLRELRPRPGRVRPAQPGDDAPVRRAHEDELVAALEPGRDRRRAARPRSRTGSTTAGVEVIEARISHLAYAPEIANAMLRRQQATAVIAARSRIVEGAVGMVEMALEQLSAKNVVELDDERKAQMVSNLLVVLCSEHETQPVVNAGTLYA